MNVRHGLIREVWQAAMGDDVTLGKQIRPNEFRVLCPFHHERNASCDVSLEKNTYLCRSCGSAGGFLDVLVNSGTARDRHEAAEWLERRGISWR